jgi:hypothetical protein
MQLDIFIRNISLYADALSIAIIETDICTCKQGGIFLKTIKNYVRAQSLEEAYTLNQKKANKIIGGMLWLKMQGGHLQTAIDLCDLNLNTIEETSEEFIFGTMTTLRQLEQHKAFNAFCQNAAQKAVKDIVGVQFRNLANIGASLWARFGFSDVLTLFLALDAEVELYKAGRIPLSQFVNLPFDNDILVRIMVKKSNCAIAYQSVRIQRTDFPVLNCAVSCIDKKMRAVIGARPGKAMVFFDENHLLDNGITEESAKSFGKYVAEQVTTQSNVRGTREYRRQLAEVLTTRCTMELRGNEN